MARFAFLAKDNWLKLLLSLIRPESTKLTQQNAVPISFFLILFRLKRTVEEFFPRENLFNRCISFAELHKTWKFDEARFRGKNEMIFAPCGKLCLDNLGNK